jgi:tRNA-dihydrouridine synthase C
MAENARHIAELGAIGIEVNFGCPAKSVNRHDGGSVLLKTPERLYHIMTALRQALPKHIPISGKMRLGYESTDLCLENAKALEAGGAERITVHARTKEQGYRPPAHWEWITKVREHVNVPVVANGDITNYEDLLRCEEVTGCSHFMIGRGVLQNAFLFSDLREGRLQKDFSPEESWLRHKPLVQRFFAHNSERTSPLFAQARTKQWLSLLSKKHPLAASLFEKIKVIHDPIKFSEYLTES